MAEYLLVTKYESGMLDTRMILTENDDFDEVMEEANGILEDLPTKSAIIVYELKMIGETSGGQVPAE
jgi:hypothetical protein